MKDLKILFALDIDKPLKYRMSKLVNFGEKYYKVEPFYMRNIKEEDLTNCFYTIVEENKLLETIYKDKVVVFRQVVENIYEPKEEYKEIVKKLRIHTS